MPNHSTEAGPGIGRGTGESIFHPDALELLYSEFAANLSYYRNYDRGDALAEMLLGLALDIIDCTYFVYTKSIGGTRGGIASCLVEQWSEDTMATHLPGDTALPAVPGEVVEQNQMLLEILRDKYNRLVRGPKQKCWKEATSSIDGQMERCRSWDECLEQECEGDVAVPVATCPDYFAAWKSTMLTLENGGDLAGDPPRFAAAILDQCRILSLLVLPDRLEQHLSTGSWAEREKMPNGRTVRGTIVRLLSMLIDDCLADLSRKMCLPENQHFYLARPPC